MNKYIKIIIVVLFTTTITGCGKLSEALNSQRTTLSTETTSTTVSATSTNSSTTTTGESTTSSKTTQKKTTTKNYFKAGDIKVYYGKYKQTQGYD